MATASELMQAISDQYPKLRIEVTDWEYETNYVYEGYDHHEAWDAIMEAHAEDEELDLVWIELIDTATDDDPHLGSIKLLIPEIGTDAGICHVEGIVLHQAMRKIEGQLELPLEYIA